MRYSWMFISQSAFANGEDKSMYDQLTQGEISYWPIYIFSLEFITTALTTVGFGSHSYSTDMEMIFVVFLILFFL